MIQKIKPRLPDWTYTLDEAIVKLTPDFFWYELSTAKAKLQEVQNAMDKILKTFEARQEEQNAYITHLRATADRLQAQLNALRKD